MAVEQQMTPEYYIGLEAGEAGMDELDATVASQKEQIETARRALDDLRVVYLTPIAEDRVTRALAALSCKECGGKKCIWRYNEEAKMETSRPCPSCGGGA